MIAHFECRASGLSTKLDILLIRITPEAFRDIGSDGLHSGSKLTIEYVAFFRREVLEQRVDSCSEFSCKLPDDEILEIADRRERMDLGIYDFRISIFEFRHVNSSSLQP